METYEEIHIRSDYKGPSPRPPRTANQALSQIVEHSSSWIRRCDEAWFPSLGVGVLDDIRIRSQAPDLACFDAAVEATRVLAEAAIEAHEELTRLKALVTSKPGKSATKPAKKPKSPSRKKR
jgi:hypothetical protein